MTEEKENASYNVNEVGPDDIPSNEITTAEKKFIRKMDLLLIPMFGSMYFFSYLDRSNIGNAKLAGLMEDINLTDSQFSTASSVLYATYITVQIPGVLLFRMFKANHYLAGMMSAWALVTIFSVFVNSYGSLVATRVLIGLFEGSFYSCLSVYISNTYQPNEMGRRFAYLFIFSSFSSAFGGLIATGITEISSGPLPRWKYLYLIEGLLTMVAVCFVFIFLPSEPRYIAKNQEEREIWDLREKRRALFLGSSKFDKNQVKEAFKDSKLYFSIIIQFCQDICMYGFTTFLPSILYGIGFNVLEAQYLTIPVYMLAGGIFLTVATLSDRWKIRGPIIIFMNLISISGYIILLAVHNNSVKYFACYLITFALYLNVGLNETWLAGNSAPIDKRSTSIAANQTFGNVAGIIAPLVYRSSPYILGHSFTIACLVVSCLTAAIQSYVFYRINRERQLLMIHEEEKEDHCIGDKSIHFQYMI